MDLYVILHLIKVPFCVASTLFSALFWFNSHNSFYGIILFQNLSCHHQELVTLMIVLWRMIILYVESPRIFSENFFYIFFNFSR